MAMLPPTQGVQAPTPPTPPTPAAPPTITVGPGGATVIELPGMPARPMTARDIAALRARGAELSNQLRSVTSRRNDLARQLRTADGVDRAGLEARIAQHDQRILRIEADIAENGRLLASLPANLANARTTSTTEPPPTPFGLDAAQITGITIVGTIFVLFPLAIAFARSIWKRASRAAVAPAPADTSARLERLEQAVDAVAIEVERISEGQRYVARLLTEGSAPIFAAGQHVAEPALLPDPDPQRQSRESA
jgi:hypothetical protein